MAFAFNASFLFSGELQRAPVYAAASLRGSGVLRAAGPGRQVPELSGADVLCGSFHRFLLLHYSSPHGQTLQSSAGRDIWAGPRTGERLQVHLWAGEPLFILRSRIVFAINPFFFPSLSSGKPSPAGCGPSCDLRARLDPETGDLPGQQVQGKISLHHAPG